MIFKTDKDIAVNNITVIPNMSFKLTRTEEKNISNTFKYLAEELHYKTTTDRCISIDIDIKIRDFFKVETIINITPCFRGVIKKSKNANAETLGRQITIVSNYDTKNGDILENGLFQKHLIWTLEYFGLMIMYSRDIQQIRLDLMADNYKVTIT